MLQNAHLRIFGQGEVEVDMVVAYLADLVYAYNSVIVFESVVEGAQRASKDYPFPLHPITLPPVWRHLGLRRVMGYSRDWTVSPKELALLIPRSEELILAGVQLGSPGFWEFLGKLNPLEVIRQYLNDRHEQRKDREYRETAEKRRLRLENLQRENEVIAGRIRIARELGATDRDLAPFLNELINRPLEALDRHQDRGVIERAELPNLPHKAGG